MTLPKWVPDPERVRKANLTKFIGWLDKSGYTTVRSYAELHHWSIMDASAFWAAVWKFCQIKASSPWSEVVDNVRTMPGARWFEGARLNFAENLLWRCDDAEALVLWNEHGRQRSLSFRELSRQVRLAARTLVARGVRPGDRVAGFLPNLPEAVIAMLATTSVGAIWSSCSPDFGPGGILDRFGQISPRVLFATDGYVWAGNHVEIVDRVRELAAKLPSLEHTVIVPCLRSGEALAAAVSQLPGGCLFEDLLLGNDDDAAPIFEQLPFDHPLYILYSSGTTGLPKCIVHGAGGTLLQHLKELVFHADLQRDDRFLYYTTCGWMMWNWLVSSLAVGATVVLYDGSPLPTERPGILYDIAATERLSHFGVSARYLSLAEKQGLRPAPDHDFTALRMVLSTGSPLAPTSFDYVYREVKKDVCLSSISGGTDIVSCFALGNPIGPVFRGEIQALGLGMSVEVWREDGRPLEGVPGELVCTQAFPSMPVSFWNDPDGSRYRAAYFEHFSGVWRQGDWAELTAVGGLIIYGRSDATLNPGGVRIGTAEIYRQVEQLPEILESLVIGQDWEGDIRIVLFVRLREGVEFDVELKTRIRSHLRANASPRHVPVRIVAVADLPRTISGKLSEIAVRKVVHGRPVENIDALANPKALDLFRNLPELAI